MIKTKFSAIIINVTNLDISEKWYQEVLGFETLEKNSPNFMHMKKDGLDFYLETPDNGFEERRQAIGTWRGISFEVDDIYGFFKQCHTQRVTILKEPELRPWGDIDGKIADPDGNILIIDRLGKSTSP